MIAGVADTHAAVWYLFGDPRLSPGAKSFIDQAAASRRTIEISPISLAEVVYLLEKKNRLPASAFDSLRGALVNPKHVFKEAPLTGDVVKAMQLIPREVPDMPDRIVAATAVYFGVPVISRDGKIRASNVRTIW